MVIAAAQATSTACSFPLCKRSKPRSGSMAARGSASRRVTAQLCSCFARAAGLTCERGVADLSPHCARAGWRPDCQQPWTGQGLHSHVHRSAQRARGRSAGRAAAAAAAAAAATTAIAAAAAASARCVAGECIRRRRRQRARGGGRPAVANRDAQSAVTPRPSLHARRRRRRRRRGVLARCRPFVCAAFDAHPDCAAPLRVRQSASMRC